MCSLVDGRDKVCVILSQPDKFSYYVFLTFGVILYPVMSLANLKIEHHRQMKCLTAYPFPKQQILDSSKLKDFADNNFRFNDNGRSSLQFGAV